MSPPKYSGTGAFGALDTKTSSQPPVTPGVTIVATLRVWQNQEFYDKGLGTQTVFSEET
jgi:hypothetical protein